MSKINGEVRTSELKEMQRLIAKGRTRYFIAKHLGRAWSTVNRLLLENPPTENTPATSAPHSIVVSNQSGLINHMANTPGFPATVIHSLTIGEAFIYKIPLHISSAHSMHNLAYYCGKKFGRKYSVRFLKLHKRGPKQHDASPPSSQGREVYIKRIR